MANLQKEKKTDGYLGIKPMTTLRIGTYIPTTRLWQPHLVYMLTN